MSEGGAESAGEENRDTKADFFEKGGWGGGEKKIHLQTFWQAVFASHSHFLSFFFLFSGFATLRHCTQNLFRKPSESPPPPPPPPPTPRSPPLRGPQSCNYTRNHDHNFTGSLRPASPAVGPQRRN